MCLGQGSHKDCPYEPKKEELDFIKAMDAVFYVCLSLILTVLIATCYFEPKDFERINHANDQPLR